MPETYPLAITLLPIGDLRPDPANPRRISDGELESLTRSIREFGLVEPVVVRKEDHVVIGGHQRLLAARRLGLKQVPVIGYHSPNVCGDRSTPSRGRSGRAIR